MDGKPLNNSDSVYQQMMDALACNERRKQDSTLNQANTLPIERNSLTSGLQPTTSVHHNVAVSGAGVVATNSDGSAKSMGLASQIDSSLPPTSSMNPSSMHSAPGSMVCVNIPEYGLIKGTLIRTPGGKLLLSSLTKDNKTINISLNPRMFSHQNFNNHVRLVQPPMPDVAVVGVRPPHQPNNRVVKMEDNSGTVKLQEYLNSSNNFTSESNFAVNARSPVSNQTASENSVLNFASCLNTTNSSSNKPNDPTCFMQKNHANVQWNKGDGQHFTYLQPQGQQVLYDPIRQQANMTRLRTIVMDNQNNQETSMPSLIPVVASAGRSIQPTASATNFYQPVRMNTQTLQNKSEPRLEANVMSTPSNVRPIFARNNSGAPIRAEAGSYNPPSSNLEESETIRNPFDIFSLEVQKNYIKKNKTTPTPAFVDMISQMWDALPDEQKDAYVVKFKKLGPSSLQSSYVQTYSSDSTQIVSNETTKQPAKKRKISKNSHNLASENEESLTNPKKTLQQQNVTSKITLIDKTRAETTALISDSLKNDKKPSNSFTDMLFDTPKVKQNVLGSSVTSSTICLNLSCQESPKFSRERGGTMYCSNECLVSHCCGVFNKLFP